MISKADRDAQIVRAAAEGKSHEEIGREFGLTSQRVYQIRRAEARRQAGEPVVKSQPRTWPRKSPEEQDEIAKRMIRESYERRTPPVDRLMTLLERLTAVIEKLEEKLK